MIEVVLPNRPELAEIINASDVQIKIVDSNAFDIRPVLKNDNDTVALQRKGNNVVFCIGGISGKSISFLKPGGYLYIDQVNLLWFRISSTKSNQSMVARARHHRPTKINTLSEFVLENDCKIRVS